MILRFFLFVLLANFSTILSNDMLTQLGYKPSKSEEHGLSLLSQADLRIFSPGISTGGFAEIRMAFANNKRTIITTTIDQKGLEFARENIAKLGIAHQINAKLEDLTQPNFYQQDYFDYIYARLVLHYLSAAQLDTVLLDFRRILKKDGKLFIIVRSIKNIDYTDKRITYDSKTKFTTEIYYDQNGKVTGSGKRYFHSPASIKEHVENAGFKIVYIKEYTEQLYKDFKRTEKVSQKDHLIEILAQ